MSEIRLNRKIPVRKVAFASVQRCLAESERPIPNILPDCNSEGSVRNPLPLSLPLSRRFRL